MPHNFQGPSPNSNDASCVVNPACVLTLHFLWLGPALHPALLRGGEPWEGSLNPGANPEVQDYQILTQCVLRKQPFRVCYRQQHRSIEEVNGELAGKFPGQRAQRRRGTP